MLLLFIIFFIKIIGKVKNIRIRCVKCTELRGGAVRKLLCDRLCNCQQGISGADDEELLGEVLAHLCRITPR
jgi:hypothetical protein